MSFIDCRGIAVFDFANLYDCTQLNKELTHKLIDVPSVVNPLVDSPLISHFLVRCI